MLDPKSLWSHSFALTDISHSFLSLVKSACGTAGGAGTWSRSPPLTLGGYLGNPSTIWDWNFVYISGSDDASRIKGIWKKLRMWYMKEFFKILTFCYQHDHLSSTLNACVVRGRSLWSVLCMWVAERSHVGWQPLGKKGLLGEVMDKLYGANGLQVHLLCQW